MREVNGWIVVDVVEAARRRAAGIRLSRSHMRQDPRSKATACFDAGHLGEIYFDRWLRHCGVKDYEWFLDDPLGKADFRIGPVDVEIKTVRRKEAPLPHYTAHALANQLWHKVDEFFFCCYVAPASEMWLLGGVSREDFLLQSQFYPAGSYIHQNYQVSDDVHNIELGLLKSPRAWLLDIILPP